MHPNPGKVPRDGVRTPYGQSGSLRGLELVPSKWRSLVPGERRDGAQSHPCCRDPLKGHNASRWAAYVKQ